MAEQKVELKELYPVPDAVKEKAFIKGKEEYEKLYKSMLNGSRNGTRSRIITLITGRAPSLSSISMAGNSMSPITVLTSS